MGPGPGWVVAVAYGLSSPLSAGVMWLEIVLASVLGFVIYWFVSRDKEETLPLEDGWWGPGARPPGREDESIRPFKVETSDQEIDVRLLLPTSVSSFPHPRPSCVTSFVPHLKPGG